MHVHTYMQPLCKYVCLVCGARAYTHTAYRYMYIQNDVNTYVRRKDSLDNVFVVNLLQQLCLSYYFMTLP